MSISRFVNIRIVHFRFRSCAIPFPSIFTRVIAIGEEDSLVRNRFEKPFARMLGRVGMARATPRTDARLKMRVV